MVEKRTRKREMWNQDRNNIGEYVRMWNIRIPMCLFGIRIPCI